MFFVLLFLFTVLPATELIVLFHLSTSIGLFNTILLIFFTGVVGVFFVKQQGLGFYLNLRSSLSSGKDPGESLLHGFFIFLGGVLLITPGLITDVWGFLMLFSFSRHLLVLALKKLIHKKMKKDHFKVYTYSSHSKSNSHDFNTFFDHEFNSFHHKTSEDGQEDLFSRRDSHNIIDLNKRKKED